MALGSAVMASWPLLSACANSGLRPISPLTQLKQAYANEPYDVLIVDRSKFDPRFWPAKVTAPVRRPVGSIVIDTKQRLLYFYQTADMTRRYGIAVGASGHAWSGSASVGRKATWPSWHPTDDMRNQSPGLPKHIPPGTHNPLGARALYLFQGGHDTLYRIHGTSEPWTIGTEASSGCIRLLNEDIIDLYDRVSTGAAVTVI